MPISQLQVKLVAGGALAGVVVAVLSIPPEFYNTLQQINCEKWLGEHLGDGSYQLLAVVVFLIMGITFYRVATSVNSVAEPAKAPER